MGDRSLAGLDVVIGRDHRRSRRRHVVGEFPFPSNAPGGVPSMGPGGKNLPTGWGWPTEDEYNSMDLILDDIYAADHREGDRNRVIGADEAARDKRVSQRAMDMAKLKVVPVSVARVLLKDGQQIIDATRKAAEIAQLPGASARDNVYWKLQWHANELASKYANAKPEDTYVSGADIKTWVTAAFNEADAAAEGLATLDKAWKDMWAEIATALAALPAAIIKAAGDVASNLAWYAKATYWIVAGAVLVAVALIAWGVSAGIKHRIANK